MSKPQDLFTISDNLDHPICLGSGIDSKAIWHP